MPRGHLTTKEREIIAILRENGKSLGEIADRIGRNKGTVSREIKRNSTGAVYVPLFAQEKGQERKRNVKMPWRMNPRRPLEASGTSGEKALLNGALNLSVPAGRTFRRRAG